MTELTQKQAIIGRNTRGHAELFDLELARQQEAKRRLKVLGSYATEELAGDQLHLFAEKRCLPVRVLVAWKHDFQLFGETGLIPKEWEPLTQASQEKVIERYKLLGNKVIDASFISKKEFARLEEVLGSRRKTERLLQRYQINGLWGLAPEYDPEKASQKASRLRMMERPPAQAAANPDALREAEQRKEIIKPFLEKKRISNVELEEHGKQYGLSWRMLRNYLHAYRLWGLTGLLPKERSDKGRRHSIGSRIETLIEAIRLSHRDIPLHHVHTLVSQKAVLLGEATPSMWQVRTVCSQLGEEMTLVADGRFDEFRSRFRTTYRFYFDGSIITYQIDFTPVDMLLRDKRRRGFHTKSQEKRCYLTLCMDSSSRLVMSYAFTYDEPTSETIASVIRDALLTSKRKPYGGCPDAIWVDKGGQMISHHIQQLAKDLHFELHACEPNHQEDHGNPQEKGIVERFFGTLNTRLWSTLHGYTHSNTEDRHPHVEAVLTIEELVKEFENFIEKYHREVHSTTKETPLEFWKNHCCAIPIDPRKVDHLTLVSCTREHFKVGIKYAGRIYWHDDLQAKVPTDAQVLVRAHADWMKPDEIQIFYEDQWVCSAFAIDSAKGREVTGKRVVTAQRRQKGRIKEEIREKQAVLKEADQEILEQGRQRVEQEMKEQEKGNQVSQEAPTDKKTPPTSQRSRAANTKQRGVTKERDIWDKFLAREKERNKK